jgi:hypothetical protein
METGDSLQCSQESANIPNQSHINPIRTQYTIFLNKF